MKVIQMFKRCILISSRYGQAKPNKRRPVDDDMQCNSNKTCPRFPRKSR